MGPLHEDTTHVTRRQVLALGALGAAAALAACASPRSIGNLSSTTSSPPPPDPPPSSTSTTAVTTSTVAPSVDPASVAEANAGRVPVQWGVDVDGVHTRLIDAGSAVSPTLALTFDACGGPGGSGVDAALLDLLETEAIAATLFLNQRWIEANRDLAERLTASPRFEIGNHGSRHLPLSVTGRSAYGIPGTIDARDAAAEVWSNHELLTTLLGEPPRWFRSGTAHYDEVATSIAVELGEQPVGFTTNGDLGATATPAQVTAELLGAPAGGIVLAHMNQPAGGTAGGLAAALPRLRAGGVRFVTLSEGGGTRP